jgi:hypothetical protein
MSCLGGYRGGFSKARRPARPRLHRPPSHSRRPRPCSFTVLQLRSQWGVKLSPRPCSCYRSGITTRWRKQETPAASERLDQPFPLVHTGQTVQHVRRTEERTLCPGSVQPRAPSPRAPSPRHAGPHPLRKPIFISFDAMAQAGSSSARQFEPASCRDSQVATAASAALAAAWLAGAQLLSPCPCTIQGSAPRGKGRSQGARRCSCTGCVGLCALVKGGSLH